MVTDRNYTAATLEFSQPENEERKVKALAAATSELEKLFKKQDFGRMKVDHIFHIFIYLFLIDTFFIFSMLTCIQILVHCMIVFTLIGWVGRQSFFPR